MPAKKTTAKKTAPKKKPAKKAVAKKTPAKKVAVKKAAAKKGVAKKAPAKKVAVKKAAAKKGVAKKTPATKAPAKKNAAKKGPVKKATAKKAPAKKTASKKAPAKKVAAKKAPVKKVAAKKTPAKKEAQKKAPVKKIADKKTVTEKTTVKKKVVNKAKAAKTVKNLVSNKSETAGTKKSSAASAGFSLEDALSIAKKRTKEEDSVAKKMAAKEQALKAVEEAERKSEKRVLGAASLSDILGFDPATPEASPVENRKVPRKYKKFFDLLIELRDHVKSGLNMHTEETLKRSSKDDSGDLSGYSQHMADAGTDTFDRDFALSMVSSEQDALTEVELAIERIFNGTYGVCEMTGKLIREERLMAVPFTRYSVETQKQLEKNQTRSVQRGGIFTDATSEDAMRFANENSDS